ncbi:MAG: hypothetical protein K6U08_00705 [Firmicutes bacterium]|nr:hypothetical protein [Bacillota bacterium]
MLHLVHLGLVSATRNLGRSLLTVVSMAVASLMVTGSLTVAAGYTPLRAQEYRAYLGGDILVYPACVWMTEADLAMAAETGSRLAVVPTSFGSPLAYFHPDFYSQGYLTTDPDGAPRYSMFKDLAELERVETLVRSVEGVVAVTRFEAVPVLEGSIELRPNQAGLPAGVELVSFFLRTCPPNLLEDAEPEEAGDLALGPHQADPPDIVTVDMAAGETIAAKKDWRTGVYPTGSDFSRFPRGSDGDAVPRDRSGPWWCA